MNSFPIYVISLPHREDRRQELQANWNRYGPGANVIWIDGIRPARDEILWAEMKGMEAYGKDSNLRSDYIVGAVGCKRAGIAALDRLLEDGHEWGLVCQDDCHWKEGAMTAARIAMDELPGDADMLYFSAHSRRPNRQATDHLVRLGGARNCTAILFRRGYVQEMLPRLMACDTEWDLFMEREHVKAIAYCVMPMLAYQARSFSDIVQREVKPPNR